MSDCLFVNEVIKFIGSSIFSNFSVSLKFSYNNYCCRLKLWLLSNSNLLTKCPRRQQWLSKKWSYQCQHYIRQWRVGDLGGCTELIKWCWHTYHPQTLINLNINISKLGFANMEQFFHQYKEDRFASRDDCSIIHIRVYPRNFQLISYWKIL